MFSTRSFGRPRRISSPEPRVPLSESARRLGSAVTGRERLTIATLSPPGRLDQDRRRRSVVLALAALLVVALLVLGWSHARPHAPRTLTDAALVGVRGPACLRLAVASDVSGSMSSYSQPREDAVAELLAWAPKNLRTDDEIGVLEFADTAAWLSKPAIVSSSSPGVRLEPTAESALGGGTELAPVLAAVRSLPASQCRTALVLVSDGQFADLPGSASAALVDLQTAHVDDFALLVPSRHISVPREWSSLFPYSRPAHFDGSDSDATALVFGGTIAHLTGQRLERR